MPKADAEAAPLQALSESRRDRLPLVAEVCPDDAAAVALSLTRFVAAGYMTGDVACWDAAYTVAEGVLGAADGQRVVAAMTGLVRAIRAERATDWSFMPTSCCRVTAAEQQLMGLLALVRAGRGTQAEAAARALTGGEATRLLAAVAVAAGLLAAVAPLVSLRDAAPAHPPAPAHVLH